MTAGALQAQDWPQWRGPNRDGKSAGFTAPAAWPKTAAWKWRAAVGAGDSTPALVGDRLYSFTRQGNNEVIMALNAADGKELWRNEYPAAAPTGGAARHPGPRGCPAVAEGKVLTVGVQGVVSCLDAATGKLLWRADEFPGVVPQFFAAMSPLIVKGAGIVHVGGRKGAVIAFDLAEGKAKWRWAGDGPAYASPILMTVEGVQHLVVQGDQMLTGLALDDGRQLWQLPTPVEGRNNNAATPVLDGRTLVVTGQGHGTKAVALEKQGDTYSLKELWTNPQLGARFNTPVLNNGGLFGISDKGNLYCIDAKSGRTAWTDTNKLSGFGSVVDAGTVLVALSENAELIVFKPSAERYDEVARLKVADGPIYAHPLLAGRRLFIKDSTSLALMEL